MGLLAEQGLARLHGGDVAIRHADDAAATGVPLTLDSLTILAEPGQDSDELTTRLEPLLPTGLTVALPVNRNAQIAQLQSLITANMFSGSLMVILLGALLIYNTLAVAVTQRRREIGILRALGVNGRTIRRLFLLESGVLGLIGTLLGLPAGLALLQLFHRLIPPPPVEGMSLAAEAAVPPLLWFVALLLGTAIPLVAGYLPARHAAAIDPLDALSPATAETTFLSFSRSRQRLSWGLILVGFLIYALIGRVLPDEGTLVLAWSSLAIYLPIIGVALLLPGYLVGAGGPATRLMSRWFGVPGLLAAENLSQRPKRISTTAVLIFVALTLGVTVSGFGAALTDYADGWQASENVWDVIAVGPGGSATGSGLGLAPAVVAALPERETKQIAAAERLTTIRADERDNMLPAAAIASHGAEAQFMRGKRDEAAANNRLRDSAQPAVLDGK